MSLDNSEPRDSASAANGDKPIPTNCNDTLLHHFGHTLYPEYTPTEEELMMLATKWHALWRDSQMSWKIGDTNPPEVGLVAEERLTALEMVLPALAFKRAVDREDERFRRFLGDTTWKIFSEGTDEQFRVHVTQFSREHGVFMSEFEREGLAKTAVALFPDVGGRELAAILVTAAVIVANCETPSPTCDHEWEPMEPYAHSFEHCTKCIAIRRRVKTTGKPKKR